MTIVKLILTYGIDRAKDIASEKIPNSMTIMFSHKVYTRPRLNSDGYQTTDVTLSLMLDAEKSEISFVTQNDWDMFSDFENRCKQMQKSFSGYVDSIESNWVVPEDNESDKEDFLNTLTDGKTFDQILEDFKKIKTAEAPKTPPLLPIIITETQKYSPATGKHAREERQSPDTQSKRLSLR